VQTLIKIGKKISVYGLVYILVLIFRSSFYEPYRIPSGSMIPTLHIGDFIMVNKYSYGLKIPFSDSKIGNIFDGNPIYPFGLSMPARGDVIVFKYPRDHSSDYIKRVVGLPGDTVEIKNKMLFINDKEVEVLNVEQGEEVDRDNSTLNYRLKYLREKFPNKTYLIQHDVDNFYKNNVPKIKIPPNKFFVMGDNRDYSQDSRTWGLVSRDEIKGKAFLVWMSFKIPMGEGEAEFNWRRLGLSIK